jgi:hypothetical protein
VPHAAARALTILGGLSLVIGVATIGYAHFSTGPDLTRFFDLVRRAVHDAEAGIALLARTVRTTAAVHEATGRLSRRNDALLGSAIDASERLADATSDVGEAVAPLVTVVERLGRDLRTVIAHARQVREAARALAARARDGDPAAAAPLVARAEERIEEARVLVTETRPERAIVLLADLIGGLYILLGVALMVAGTSMRCLPGGHDASGMGSPPGKECTPCR